MRSPRHNFSKMLSNRNEILQTCSGVNVVVPNTFWVYSIRGFRCWGTSKWKNFAMLFQAGFRNIEIFSWIIFCCVETDLQGITNFIFSWLEWQTRMVDPSCKINFLWRHRSEREAINPNSILSNFSRQKKTINFVFQLFQPATYSDGKTLVTIFHQIWTGSGGFESAEAL